MKILIIALMGLFVMTTPAGAQKITRVLMSSGGGQLKGGGFSLMGTLGELVTGRSEGAAVSLSNGFWQITPTTYVPLSLVVYRFVGSGVFADAANWEGGILPPNPLPAGSEIVINPPAGGQCLINAAYQVSRGARFSVTEGKKLVITGNLELRAP